MRADLDRANLIPNSQMGSRAVLSLFLFLIPWIIEGSLRTRAYGSDAVDFQVIFKLGFWGLSSGLALLYARSWLGKLFRLDNIFLLPLLLIVFISCFYAPSPYYSLGAAFSVFAVLALIYASASLLEPQKIMFSLLSSISILLLLSIVLYFVLPDYARGKEWVNDIEIPGHRLAGISNPNAIGFISAFGVLLTIFYKKFDPYISPKILYLFGAINVLALLMSNSRSSLLALLVAMAALFFLKKSLPRMAILFALIGIGTALFATVDLTPLLAKFSRSGNISEITTGTGRTYIWAVAIELIKQRPWTGWGYASSSFIIPMHASEIGHMPGHTHNLFLQLTFSAGFIALGLFVVLLLVKFIFALRQGDRFKIALLIFMIVHGMTEPSVFQGVAGMATLVFGLIMALDKNNFPDERTDSSSARSR